MEIKFKHLLLATLFSVPFLYAKAELIDHSKFYIDGEEITYMAINGFSAWRYKPEFVFPKSARYRINCSTGVDSCSFKVILQLDVNPEGNIISTRILKSSGNKYLDDYSISKAKFGKFNPYYIDDEAVYVKINLPIKYVIPITNNENTDESLTETITE